MILGVDLSHHKEGGSLRTLKEQGYSFVILKASEGSGFVDHSFRNYLDQADEFGLPVAAYHYVRASSNMESQVNLISKVVPENVPVILDVERGSGSQPSLWRDMISELKKLGYTVPFLYLPRWYWEQIGQPDLSGFPPLWGSRYVSGRVRGSEAFQHVAPTWWNGYGNNFVGMLQFSSQIVVDGLPPDIDVSAFVGSTSDLLALFNSEDTVSAAEVWAYILESGDGYRAPASEWMTAISGRVEDMKLQFETFRDDSVAFMADVRGKLDGVTGPTVEQMTQAFQAALPNLKVTGEFHGGSDTTTG